MPLIETSGNVTADAYAGGVAVKPKYIEDFFQTWLRTGTGASATVTTGLDASTNKALVWTKSRSAATDHKLTDTVRGATKALISDTTGAQTTDTNGLTAFSATGYTIGSDTNYNNSGATYVDWEFVATPKFFDVVTWTADSSGTGQAVSHNLGSIPGCIIVKATTSTSSWFTWHIATDITVARTGFQLNSTAASALSVNSTGQMTSTEFFSGQLFDSSYNRPVTDGTTYVAYLFAHNAGGFGLTGTDNVISCGSYTDGGNVSVTLGYEPQWLLLKRADGASDWFLVDVMRGQSQTYTAKLRPNSSVAESSNGVGFFSPTATGFINNTSSGFFADGANVIYIAIRRGPMKVPTDATTVYLGKTRTGDGSLSQIDSSIGFPPDWALIAARAVATDKYQFSRLQGNNNALITNATDAEFSSGLSFTGATGTINIGNGTGALTNSGRTYIDWYFKRAPSFFDEVCYTGTGSASANKSHNLGVVPELMIVKGRNIALDWIVYSATLGNAKEVNFNSTSGSFGSGRWNFTTPTSTEFYVSSASEVNGSGYTYVAYLFATCLGVSKVGSYTGTGATQTISCGFTGGARFVLIKRTDSTGSWFVWDTARGMVAGTDPRLPLNATTAESNANWVYTATGGFQIVTTDANVNASGGTYIFLAIA